MSRDRTPYPVRLYDPPLSDDTPGYGDEDAPAAEAGLCFAEYLLSVAVQFQSHNTDAGDYIAGLIRSKANVCVTQGFTTPKDLANHDVIEQQMFRSDRAFRDVMNGRHLPVRKF